MSIIQQKVPAPDGKGTIWTCPLRDIAHFMPHALVLALDYMASEVDKTRSKETMDTYAGCVQTFIRLAADPTYEGYRKDMVPNGAWAASGLASQDEVLHVVFQKYLTMILLTNYFNGVREALHPGETAFGLDALTSGGIRRSKPWWKFW